MADPPITSSGAALPQDVSMSGMIDRHLQFVEALRRAGLPVSLSEGLDAVGAIEHINLADRAALRSAYAATMIKNQQHRATFDQIFDIYFPAMVGERMLDSETAQELVAELLGEKAAAAEDAPSPGAGVDLGDGPDDLAEVRDRLAGALIDQDRAELVALARESVDRFGLIREHRRGQQQWSTHNVLTRIDPDRLVPRLLASLGRGLDSQTGLRRLLEAQVLVFGDAVAAEVRRRDAELRGPDHVANHTVRPTLERIDFTAARREELVRMRREIEPLARRLAARLNRRHTDRRHGPVDFRRTVRASLSTGGVPLVTIHRPRHASRSDLVILCDVSGSVSHFANFTLMLVYALREQFDRLRAFTFIDDIHEVTDRFPPGTDPNEALQAIAASAEHAARWGRTDYGRAFRRFVERHPDAVTARTNVLILGDARSNYSDLAIPVVSGIVRDARNVWWLNPEHSRHWNTADSAAGQYGALIPMIECRNLTQLGDFVRDLM